MCWYDNSYAGIIGWVIDKIINNRINKWSWIYI